MLRDTEEGGQLSQAMKRHPKVFDSVYTSMVAAGESGGFLKDILDRIVEILEKRQALITQLKSSLTYPLVLGVVSVIVIIFIMVGVLPKFNSFFMSKIEVLPWTTKTLMVLSDVLKTYWWIMIVSVIGIITGFILFIGSKKGRGIIDWLLINIPLIADLANRIYIAQFLRILGNLMQSKVPLLEALDVTQGTVTNKYFKQLVSDIKFSQPFSIYPYVPESVKQMIFTGEESGRLPKVMLRLAEFFDTEVEKNLKILASLIEPLALIIMGAVIGLIVSSVILPLFRLAHVMH